MESNDETGAARAVDPDITPPSGLETKWTMDDAVRRALHPEDSARPLLVQKALALVIDQTNLYTADGPNCNACGRPLDAKPLDPCLYCDLRAILDALPSLGGLPRATDGVPASVEELSVLLGGFVEALRKVPRTTPGVAQLRELALHVEQAAGDLGFV